MNAMTEKYWPKGANGENLLVPIQDVEVRCGCIVTHSNDGCGMFKSEVTHSCLKHRSQHGDAGTTQKSK